MKLRLAVLLSGSGTTLQNIIDHCEAETLDATVSCVIASRASAFGLVRAAKHGIPAYAVTSKDYPTFEQRNDAIWDTVRSHGAGLVVLAGYMSLLKVPEDFTNRISLTITPLFPVFFKGLGMKTGMDVLPCLVWLMGNRPVDLVFMLHKN